MKKIKQKTYNLLRWSEKYFKTDMVYLTRSGFWINLTYVVDSLLSFVLAISFAYFLSQETYGVYKYIIAAAGVFAAFSLTGMNMAVVRASAQNFDGIFKRSLFVQLRWSIPQFLILCLVGLYYLFRGNDVLGISFLFIGLLAPLSSITNTYGAFLQGKKEFRTLALYGLASSLFNFTAISIAIIFIKNPVLLILIYYSARATANTFFCIRTFRKYRPTDLFRQQDIDYGKHLSLMNIIGTIAGQIDSVVVFHYLGPVSVAIYNFATVMPERIKGLFGFVGTAALSRMSEKKDLEVGKNISHKIGLLVLIALGITFSYVIAAPFLFSLLFPKYIGSVLYSQIFSISIISIAGSIPIGALYAKKLQKELYILNIAGPILKIVIFIAATYSFGLWGAIIAKVLYSFVQLAIPVQLLFGSVEKSPSN